MSRVSISVKTARLALMLADGKYPGVADELRRALQPRKRRPADPRKTAKRESAKEKRSAVRDAVMSRANGYCEVCRIHSACPLELDHFFGRARAESVDTCWAVCRWCHHKKTNNSPSAQHWLRAFIEWSGRYGFHESAAKAQARLDAIQLIETAAQT